MEVVKFIAIGFLCFSSADSYAKPNLDNTLNKILADHFQKYKEKEYFSGITLSTFVPKESIKNYYIGLVSHDADSKPIDQNTLFEIGSITKSFTAAVLLQLDDAKKVSMQDAIGQWFPEYSNWGDIKVCQLLNMTSGLPNYSDSPLWNAKEFNDPTHVWSNKELIDYAYPPKEFSPPLKQTYFYSNTGYLLSDIIVEKLTGNTFAQEVVNRTIKLADLSNTFYPLPSMDSDVAARMAHGYNYNQYDNPAFVGKDVTDNNLSWAGAAGAMISNSEDVIKWVNALFASNKILNAQERKALTSVVSTRNGKVIKETNKADPEAFGLGVAQMYDAAIGRFWFYEGETLGFRAIYIYVPCNGVVISTIFNSATNAENDHAKELVLNVYHTLMNQYPRLHC